MHGSLLSPAVQAALAQAQTEPGKWQVYLVPEAATQRTPAQNRFFRVLLRKLAQQNGQSVKYWHDYLVERFLGFDEVTTEDGYIWSVLVSTASLTVTEFSSFLEACIAVAAENNAI